MALPLRLPRRHGVLALAALAAVLLSAAPAAAQPRLEVSPREGLDPQGQQVRVRGSGYDMTKGIYVAWCKVPPPGQLPSPCGGGEDRSGDSGQSVWISSNPPPYGIGLARPYGPGGTFDVTITVARYIGDVDCFAVACAVTTRNDHERTSDRSQDVFVSVAFARPAPAPPAQEAPAEKPSTGPASPSPAPAPAPAAQRPPTTPAATPAAQPQPAPQPAGGQSPAPAPGPAPQADPLVDPAGHAPADAEQQTGQQEAAQRPSDAVVDAAPPPGKQAAPRPVGPSTAPTSPSEAPLAVTAAPPGGRPRGPVALAVVLVTGVSGALLLAGRQHWQAPR